MSEQTTLAFSDPDVDPVPWPHTKPLLPRHLWRRHLSFAEALAVQAQYPAYYTAVGKEREAGFYVAHPCSELYVWRGNRNASRA